MITSTDRRLWAAGLLLLLAACGGPEAGPETHDHGSSAAHLHGGGESTLVYTDYTDVTELFVEFPALVAGQASTFAAHVTRLDDYAPLTSGRLDVILARDGRPVARFRVDSPARTGIFTPAVTPRDTGEYSLAIEVADGNLEARHELGRVTVFPDSASVSVDQSELPGDIGYLKEQQWTNPFTTTVAGQHPLRPSVPGFGTVLAPADAGAEIRAPVDGYFASTGLVQAGSPVEQGAVLGYLVPRLGEGTDFGSLRVDLERARARLAIAERDVARLEALFADGAIAERRLIEARHEADVARAEWSAAHARIQQHQQATQEAGIALRSPVTGDVLEVNTRPGAFVRAGDRVFRIAAPDRRWLEIEIPEHFARGLQNASGAWFDADRDRAVVLDSESGAHVVQVSAAIRPVSRTASVTLEYPSDAGPATVGARFAAHVFVDAARPVLAIPRSAIIDDGGVNVVFVQTGGESFVRRPVRLGILDGGMAEVLSGVSAGERVVSSGAYYVKLASAGGEEIGHGHAH